FVSLGDQCEPRRWKLRFQSEHVLRNVHRQPGWVEGPEAASPTSRAGEPGNDSRWDVAHRHVVGRLGMSAAGDEFGIGYALPVGVEREVEHDASLHARLTAARAEYCAHAVLVLKARRYNGRRTEQGVVNGGVQVAVAEIGKSHGDFGFDLQFSGGELEARLELRDALIRVSQAYAGELVDDVELCGRSEERPVLPELGKPVHIRAELGVHAHPRQAQRGLRGAPRADVRIVDRGVIAGPVELDFGGQRNIRPADGPVKVAAEASF